MLSFLDGCVDYQQRFESHAARLFINEENGWDVQFYGVSWADGRGSMFAMWNFDIQSVGNSNGFGKISDPRSCSIEDSRQLEDLMQVILLFTIPRLRSCVLQN
jgi:hypothetical protein